MAQAKIKNILKDLLELLQVTPQKIAVEKDKEKTYQVQVDLDDQDTGIMIGYHGDTVSALQLVLGLLLYRQTGKWDRVVVNVGDYRQKREESLIKTAEDTVKRVLATGEPIALFNLNPFERRVIHLHLEKNSDVVSESDGEGRNRHLIISPKNPSVNEPPLPVEDTGSADEPQS